MEKDFIDIKEHKLTDDQLEQVTGGVRIDWTGIRKTFDMNPIAKKNPQTKKLYDYVVAGDYANATSELFMLVGSGNQFAINSLAMYVKY